MKEFLYRGFSEPIKVDDDGNATYRGRMVENYYHGYKAVGIGSGFSYNNLLKQHYIGEMNRIDHVIEIEEYREEHKEEFEELTTVDEDLDWFFEMINQ